MQYKKITMEKRKQTLSYTAAIKELEEIVAKLESPQCEVDQMVELTKRSVELLDFCKKKLTATDDSLKQLLENID